jgi:predicted benzoate:H+ symporter BenE
MVVIKGFEFSIREFAGSLGDFGTLIPFTVGYITICGFNPSGLLLGIGLTNIILALFYKLPLPVQPKKVIGSVALSERWEMNKVLGAGFSVGLIWVLLSFSSRLSSFLERVPTCIVRGIQLSLAFTLAMTGAEMVTQDILITTILMAVALLLLQNKFLPSSIFLVLFGFIYSIITGSLSINDISVNFSLPQLNLFTLDDMIFGFIYAGFAQLFLTLTNAVVATITLIHDLFPGREEVTPRTLIKNMGVMNVITPLIGGMPLCHGAGGLAAQYLFGARTGGAILMEGLLEVSLGLFFSDSLLTIFTSYPSFIVGIMLILTSIELGKVVFRRIEGLEVSVLLFTALISTAFNVAFGFFFGLLLYLALERKLIKL